MTITGARSTVAMTCQGDHTGTLQSGSVQIGLPQQATNYSSANVVYALQGEMAVSGNAMVLAVAYGTATGTTWVAGSAQIETATVNAASGCTSDGTLNLIVTSGVVAGSPLTVGVALTTASNTATKVATALAAGLAANAAVAAKYTVTSSTADVILTRVTDANGYYQATDATLNLNIPVGYGILAATTSVGTNAGVATSGTNLTDADGKDFEGVTLPTIATLNAIHFDVVSGSATIADAGETVFFPVPAFFWDSQISLCTTLTITATAAKTVLRITALGQTA